MLSHPTSDVALNVLRVLSTATAPLARPAITKALPVGGRPKAKQLDSLLAGLAADGRLIATATSPVKYILAPADAWAQHVLVAALAKAPQTEARLEKSLTASFGRLLPAALKVLVATGQAYRHPPRTPKGKPLYGLHPADPADYLAKELDKLIAKVTAKGFGPADVRRAAARLLAGAAPPAAPADSDPGTTPGDEQRLLAALRASDPRTASGGAVPLTRLREALRATLPEKDRFDRTLLALARRGVVELQSHAWPARLSAHEREQLVENGLGGWFDSASLRAPRETR